MVVVVHRSALNDTGVLAEKLVTELAWKISAWWKNWSALVSEATEVRFFRNKSKCVLSSEFLN